MCCNSLRGINNVYWKALIRSKKPMPFQPVSAALVHAMESGPCAALHLIYAFRFRNLLRQHEASGMIKHIENYKT